MKSSSKIKLLVIIGLIISLGVFIESRRIKKDTLDLMVSLELVDMYEKCNSRVANDTIPMGKRLNYNHPLYNYYIDSMGIKVCLTEGDSIKKIIENEHIKNIHENWKFVY
jgi:hypothetical protein